MKVIINKTLIFIGFLIAFTSSFLGIEYLLYRLLSMKSPLYSLYYIVLTACAYGMHVLLKKANYFGFALNLCLIMASVFIALWILSLFANVM